METRANVLQGVEPMSARPAADLVCPVAHPASWNSHRQQQLRSDGDRAWDLYSRLHAAHSGTNSAPSADSIPGLQLPGARRADSPYPMFQNPRTTELPRPETLCFTMGVREREQGNSRRRRNAIFQRATRP